MFARIVMFCVRVCVQFHTEIEMIVGFKSKLAVVCRFGGNQ